MRLQAAGVRPFHVFSDALHAAGVHGVVRQRVVFEQVAELAAV
ncbi:MAG: hypothetical protein R2712_25280 [Vicinamibacterales bacterium]